MPEILIKDHSYDPLKFLQLKRFVFNLEKKGFKFICSGLGDLKCGECLYCKCDLIKTRFDLRRLTSFYEFICHRDNEGGYVSGKVYGAKFFSDKNIYVWGDLDKLKVEVKEINRHKSEMPKELHATWKNFYNDVLSSVQLLEFKYKL